MRTFEIDPIKYNALAVSFADWLKANTTLPMPLLDAYAHAAFLFAMMVKNIAAQDGNQLTDEEIAESVMAMTKQMLPALSQVVSH